MEIILLNDGQGICRPETAEIKNGRLPLNFIGAPPYSTVAIIGETKTLRRTLSSKGESEINISELSGAIKFTVTSSGEIWHTDGVYIERDNKGNSRVVSIASYTVKFERIFNELQRLNGGIEAIQKEIKQLKSSVEIYKKEYNIV